MREKTLKFRVDCEFYNIIKQFANENGFNNMSEFLRSIIVMHMMGVFLGYFGNKSESEIMNEFLKKYLNSKNKK